MEQHDASLGGYGRVALWLRGHGLNTQQAADVLRTTVGHFRQLEFRGRQQRPSTELLPPELLLDRGIEMPPGEVLRRFLGVRAEQDSVELTPRAERRIKKSRNEIEAYAAEFWNGVRYEAGIEKLRSLLPQIGYPAQVERIRLRARIHELCSETFLHSGRSADALDQGFRAYHLYRVAFHESGDSGDLRQVGRLARLLSQTLLLRREAGLANHYLELHRSAQERIGEPPRPEYHHQLAVLAFGACDADADKFVVRAELDTARREIETTIDYGQQKKPHEVKDIGERLLPLLPPLNWDSSTELMRFQLSQYPAGDIHVGLNVATTAACGLSLNDPMIQTDALALLDAHQDAARGYRRLETNFALLRLTPRLPVRLRRHWARFALYENAHDNRDRFPRYNNSRG